MPASLTSNSLSRRSNTRTLLQTTKSILRQDGLSGLWRGTAPSLTRCVLLLLPRYQSSLIGSNVPGVALYMSSLTQLRYWMATRLPYFRAAQQADLSASGSVLPKLNSQGNLVAGAVARVSVGFLLNPLSVLKARYEVCFCHGRVVLSPALRSVFPSEQYVWVLEPQRGIIDDRQAGALRVASRVHGLITTGCSIRWNVRGRKCSPNLHGSLVHPSSISRCSMKDSNEKRVRAVCLFVRRYLTTHPSSSATVRGYRRLLCRYQHFLRSLCWGISHDSHSPIRCHQGTLRSRYSR